MRTHKERYDAQRGVMHDNLLDRLLTNGAISEDTAVPLYGSAASLANEIDSKRIGHVFPRDRGVVRWYARASE
jgi:hypothetical protein